MPERKYHRKIYQKKERRSFFFLLKFFGFVFLFFASCFLLLFIYYARELPRPEKFTERPYVQSTKIYDRTGAVLLYDIYGEEKRTVVPLNEISEYLKKAAVAAEDANFYHHFGIDLKSIGRAILVDLRLRKPAQGASTISQQLVRATFLTREKTLERKIKEVILTLEMERRYSKEQILEFYLNQIYFGLNAYGAEAAGQAYFNKPAKNLSLAESALLAAVIQIPSYFSQHKEDLLFRKDYVLDRMAELNFITEQEARQAKNEQIQFAKISQSIKAPHFVLTYVKKYLEANYEEDFLKEKGLRVYTSLNWELQEEAEKAIEEGVKINEKYNAYNGALVAIDPNAGEILAMVGSADYFGEPQPKGCEPGKNCLFEPEVNVAIFGEGQQPGSAFKPFVYAQAFKKGYTPETVLWDAKTEFNPDCSDEASEEKDKYGLECYHPSNYDGKFRGPLNIRQSLSQSINVTSIKVLYLAGIEQTINLAKTLGITTLNRPLSWYGLSLVLGGGEIKLLDMVSAYGVFATRGFKVPPVSVLKIEDSKGNIIEENKKTPQRVLESQICDLINDILSDNEARTPIFGPKSQLYFENYNVAAKTGTTQDFRDGWTIGYTPSVVVGVWVGNNNNAPMAKEPGVSLAGPIWHKVMEKFLRFYPPKTFVKPKTILSEKPILKGEVDLENPHSILHYINKDDPEGPPPEDPGLDPQYSAWERGIQNWFKTGPR